MAKAPRNLRQVGNPGGKLSIYIEDYVFTYLKSEYNTEAAILVGESCYEENGICVYIRGAIACPQLYWKEDGMQITQRTWNYIFREREHLFGGQEIVGWYMPVPSEEEEKILIALGEFHGRNFPGADKVFFYLNHKKDEEAFYARDEHIFKRQAGYYIFYEKNTTMREYMLALREERQLEADLYKEVHDKPKENMRYREFLNAELERRNSSAGSSGRVMGVLALVAGLVLIAGFGMERIGFKDFFIKPEEVMDANGDVIEGVYVPLDEVDKEEDDKPSEDDDKEEGDTQSGGDNSEGDKSPEGDGSEDGESSIIEGTQFDTPADEEMTEIAMSLAQGYYVVKQGDSLAEICRKLYGDDEKVEELCEKNNIEDPNTIYPGQILYLP